MKPIITLILTILILTTSCKDYDNTPPPPKKNPVPTSYTTEIPFGAGYRYSSYGTSHLDVINNNYWVNVGNEISGKFENATPKSIWILGVLDGEGIYLNFPANSTNPLIKSASEDFNEEIFNKFDKQGVKIWLQVEPGNAPVEDLIKIVLGKYNHHSCIIGFGVDVEWYQSVDKPDGKAVSDITAKKWLELIRSYNPEYRLFLKHWLKEKMPPIHREGIVFIDDSQDFDSKEDMIAEFKDWGERFSGAQVGFQYGYSTDKSWWSLYEDPALVIGQEILNEIPNTVGLYWVDFTLEEILMPE